MITIEEMAHILEARGLLTAWIGKKKKQDCCRYLTCDSRKVVPGTLFICKGIQFKAEYLLQAEEKGCIAYLSEKEMQTKSQMGGLLVTDIRKAMAVAAAAVFEYTPGRSLLTGITGTKGKTTTAWYLKAMLDEWKRELGEPETGLISTVETYDGIRHEEAQMTTPESPRIQELLAHARESGLSHMTMEVSSQALKYRRVKELIFQTSIFLNISEDHISPVEHEDFEDYFSAKLGIFRQTQTACVNLDMDHVDRALKAARKAERIVTFGRSLAADFSYSKVRILKHGIAFSVTCAQFSEEFVLGMKGRFNIENAMAAITAATLYGVPVHCMKKALLQTQVPGRMEMCCSEDGKLCAVVDFAHNRLSFERLYDAVYQEYGQYTNVIAVFGCQGGKALNRRKELGIIAGLFSDQVLLTMDDPGTEAPAQIAQEVCRYVELAGCPCEYIEDREAAVRKAVKLGKESMQKTLILLLGRGNEKYQKIGDQLVEYPTDSVLIKKLLA